LADETAAKALVIIKLEAEKTRKAAKAAADLAVTAA
jgi:hypothetical protein